MFGAGMLTFREYAMGDSYHQRRGQPKSGTDRRDLALLLLTFPDLKRDPGPVSDRLQTIGVEAAVMTLWRELVSQEVLPEEDDDEFPE